MGRLIAYSTNGSSTHGIVTAFMKQYDLKAKPTATGGPSPGVIGGGVGGGVVGGGGGGGGVVGGGVGWGGVGGGGGGGEGGGGWVGLGWGLGGGGVLCWWLGIYLGI
jgi:hypothetical protein